MFRTVWCLLFGHSDIPVWCPRDDSIHVHCLTCKRRA